MTNEYIALISQIDEIYISNRFFNLVTHQSCDCDEIIIKNGEKLSYLTIQNDKNEWYIDIQKINEIDHSQYIHKLDLSNEKFIYDKTLYHNSGRIDGIKFHYKNIYLFIFDLEYNLVITKSQCDLFDENTYDLDTKYQNITK
ncbi:MAG: hypothetical protein II984_10895 [Clostridia bacterium]|nr:hypothetical protein [Clostridia bacterium]